MEGLPNCTKCHPLLEPIPIPMKVGMGLERILIVGEAPGADEVMAREPFVGAAGRALDSCLSFAGLRRYDIFITNLIHCRPPNNRDPLPEEISNCKCWLDKEVAAVQPTLIIALGLAPALALTGKNFEWRGSIVDSVYGIPCLITYHPAFVLRSRTDFPVLVADLEKVAKRPKTFQETYLIAPPEVEARKMLAKWKENDATITLDIETCGEVKADQLNPWRGWIGGYAVCGSPGEGFHYKLPHPLDHGDFRWRLLLSIIEEFPSCWHNNIFDRCFVTVNGGHPREPVWDTMNGMYLLNSSSEKSLDFLRSVYTDIPPYKKEVKRRGFDALTSDDYATMNIKDVDVTQRVMRAQKPYFDPQQLSLMKRMLLLDTQAIKMRIRGVPVSREAMAANLLEIGPELEVLEEKFFSVWQLNPNSPKQLAQRLYDELAMPLPPKKRNRSARSTDEECLLWLRESTSVADAINLLDDLLAYRERDKIRGTFIQGWYDRIGPDGRLHPVWMPTGTDTGRWACNDPNMQNPPQRVRNQVVTNKWLLRADFKNLEFVVMLVMAGDFDSVHAICYEGRDIHSEMQEEINKYSPIPVKRIIVKTVVFGTAYGRTANSIARQFKVPVYIAKQWQGICFNKFPKLVALAERHRREFRERGYALSLYGRRKYCEEETQALNHPVQSTAAEIAHNACLTLEAGGYNPIINIHDELVCEIDQPENPDKTIKEFTAIFNNAGKEVYEYFPCVPVLSQCWQKEE